MSTPDLLPEVNREFLEAMHAKFLELQAQKETAEEALGTALDQIEKLGKEKEKYRVQTQKLEGLLAEYEENYVALEGQLERVTIESSKVRSESLALQATIHHQRQVETQLYKELESSSTTLGDLKSRNARLKEEIDLLSSEKEPIEKERESLKATLAEKQRLFEETEEEILQLAEANGSLEAQLLELTPQLEESEREQERLIAKEADLLQKMKDISDEKKTAEDLLAVTRQDNQKLITRAHELEEQSSRLAAALDLANTKSRETKEANRKEIEKFKAQAQRATREKDALIKEVKELQRKLQVTPELEDPEKEEIDEEKTALLKRYLLNSLSFLGKAATTATGAVGTYLFSSTSTVLISKYFNINPTTSGALTTLALIVDKKMLDRVSPYLVYAGIVGNFMGMSDLDNYLDQGDLLTREKTLQAGFIIFSLIHVAALLKKSSNQTDLK